jgi:hypothetical protein
LLDRQKPLGALKAAGGSRRSVMFTAGIRIAVTIPAPIFAMTKGRCPNVDRHLTESRVNARRQGLQGRPERAAPFFANPPNLSPLPNTNGGLLPWMAPHLAPLQRGCLFCPVPPLISITLPRDHRGHNLRFFATHFAMPLSRRRASPMSRVGNRRL